MRQRRRQRLGTGLFPVGAVVVHQLRYSLAFGDDASRELADQGHAYLHELTPWIVLALALAVGGLIARLARAWHSGESDDGAGHRLAMLWAAAAAGLFAIYVGQEFLEGLFATGHPQGLAGILGDGGLWALPAAIAVGGLLALLIRGGRALVARVARLRRERPRIETAPTPARVVRPSSLVLPRLAPLASACAGRAPPVLPSA
ncbi:MAG TPA: hypothetical protein VGC59_03430 [Solirubrobacteraceae bacterium]